MGIDANPFCLRRCKERQCRGGEVNPESRITWMEWDAFSLAPSDILASCSDPSSIVLYVYMSAGHVSRLQTLLVNLVIAGARLVMYDAHLKLPADDDAILVEAKYGDMLKVRAGCHPLNWLGAHPDSAIVPRF